MAKTTTIPAIKVPGLPALPQGNQITVFARGADPYEATRLNGSVDLVLDDGTKVTATVVNKKVGPLIDLIGQDGPNNVYTFGRIYSAVSLIQALTDAAPEDVLDVTKLYTAVTVSTPMQVPAMPGATSAVTTSAPAA